MSIAPDLTERESRRLAVMVWGMFDALSENGRALVIGHSPLIEMAVYGLTGKVLDHLNELEGVTIAMSPDVDDIVVHEIRN